MIPLATHQRVWTWLSVHSVEKDVRSWTNFNIIFTLFVFMAHLSVVLASTAFAIQFVRIDLADSLHALLHLTAFMGMTYVLAIAFISRNKIVKIFEKLTEIYQKSKHSVRFY